MIETKKVISDMDAEESVCGSLLLDKEAIFRLDPPLESSDFYSERTSLVYAACLALYRNSKPINQITVAQELNSQKSLEMVGGAAYLSHLISVCPTPLDVQSYGDIVYNLSKRRELLQAGEQIARLAEDGADLEQSLDRAGKLLYGIGSGKTEKIITVKEALKAILDKPHNPSKYKKVYTGFSELDNYLNGLHPQDLIILAARSSMGKTSLALNIARNNTGTTLFVSLEMSGEKLTLRLMAGETGVNSQILSNFLEGQAELDMEQERRFMKAAGNLSENLKLIIKDDSSLTVTQLRMSIQRVLYTNPTVNLIIVDYLGLLADDTKWGNREQAVSYISRSLKAMAREFDVPLLVLSQLSRAAEYRASHRPQLSDLRDSGSIEQDADVVIFIYRDEYYYPSQWDWEQAHPGEVYPPPAEIIIAKQRNGPTGEVKLKFNAQYTRFENIKHDTV